MKAPGFVSGRAQWLTGIGLLGVIAATRWPLAPAHLFYFDSVNFALALDDFNPALHQPQPPGYPLFVLLSRLLHIVVAQPHQVFLVAGILGAAAAAWCLWRLATDMFGPFAGFAAAALFVFSPILWFGGLTNQVRIYSAAVSCLLGWLVWRAWHLGSHGSLRVAALILGLGAGFRPPVLLFGFPLLAAAWLRGRNPRALLVCGSLLGAGVLVWLAAVILVVGGPKAYFALLASYSGEQFGATSLLFGAKAAGAWRMARSAFWWNAIGALAWIWILPLVDWGELRAKLSRFGAFFAVWFVPGYLFQSFVHVADPDQTLFTVPVVCLLGGMVLSCLHRARLAAAVLSAAASAAFFFVPWRGLLKATTYEVVRQVDRETSRTLAAINRLESAGEVQILSYDSFVTWRHLSYYFPNLPVLVIEPGRAYRAGLHGGPAASEGGAVLLDPGKRIVVVPPPPGRGVRKALIREAAADDVGPVLTIEPRPGLEFRLGNMRFKVAPPPSGNRSRSTRV